MTDGPVYMVGTYGDCMAYAEACGLGGGEWEHIQDASGLRSVPPGTDVALICTDAEYWSLKGYWHDEDFGQEIWDRDIWIQRVSMAEA